MCITSKYINPFTDYGFKKLFGEEGSKPQLISFINAFLELDNKAKIVDLEFKNLEKLGLSKRDRNTVFDIYCLDEENNHILVELQRAEQTYFKDRMIYYSSILIQEQGLKGLYYDGTALTREGNPRKVSWDYKLNAVYCIGILDFEFKESNNTDYLHYVKLKDQNNNIFYEKLNYVFVEMPKFTKRENELENYLDKWFYFLNNLESLDKIPEIFNDDKVIKNAFKKAEFINMTKEEQSTYLASLKEYRDWYAVLTTAENKGIKKGLEEAKEKIKEAQKEKEKAQKEKEEAQKREEKTLQKTKKAIIKFYKKGFSIKELAEDFDMSEDEVKEIIKEGK
jgi:predicted transposase/invertase (TIGR01784 family)